MAKSSSSRNKKQSNKNKQKNKRPLWKTLFYTLCFALLAVGMLAWQVLYTPLKMNAKQHVLNVGKGETYFGLLNKWQDKGDVAFSPLAKLYTKLAINKPLKSGAYSISKNASLAKTLQTLSGGKQAQLLRVQIIEGKRTQDLLKTIQNTQNVRINVADKPAKDIIKTLKLPVKHLEGWFAPDTYFFSQGSTDEDILQHMYKKQKRTLDKAWAGRDKNLPYKTPYDALIMASIIEKETGVAAERDKVAAVFVNRLRKGMKLQTDPTVIYGMGERYDGDIRYKDLREATPYNTYVIKGLPPTPISLPSSASIEAALHPADTDVLFFVATGDGGHTFTRTYAEHKKAVAAYLKKTRQRNAQSKS